MFRRRNAIVGLDAIIFYIILAAIVIGLSAYVLNLVQHVNPLTLIISYPQVGGGGAVDNLVPVDVRNLAYASRDIAFVFLAVAFMFAALSLALEGFRIFPEGTAWNIMAKSMLYIVIIGFFTELYTTAIAPLFAYITKYFATLPDGRNAADVLWQQLWFSSPSLPGSPSTSVDIVETIIKEIGFPVMAMLDFTCFMTSFFVAVGRFTVMLGLVVFMPVLLVLDLIPITRGFAQTLINSLIGLILSGPLVGILMHVACYAINPILSAINYSDPVIKVTASVGMVLFVSVAAGAFTYQFSSAVTAASATALSGSMGLLASVTIPIAGAVGGSAYGVASLRSVGATGREQVAGALKGFGLGLATGALGGVEYGGRAVGMPVPKGVSLKAAEIAQPKLEGAVYDVGAKNVSSLVQNFDSVEWRKAVESGADKEYLHIASGMFSGDPEKGFATFKSLNPNLSEDSARTYYDILRETYATNAGARAKLGYIASAGLVGAVVGGKGMIGSGDIRGKMIEGVSHAFMKAEKTEDLIKHFNAEQSRENLSELTSQAAYLRKLGVLHDTHLPVFRKPLREVKEKFKENNLEKSEEAMGLSVSLYG